MEIREVRPEECDAVGDLTVAAYREYMPTEPSPGWDEYAEALHDVRGRAGRTVVLAAFDAGGPVGTATIEMDDVLGDDDAELPEGTAILRMLGVAPGARRRGVGRALVEEAIDRVRRAGKHTLLLRTTPPMQVAQAMYRSMGFVRDESLDRHHPEVDLIGYRLRL